MMIIKVLIFMLCFIVLANGQASPDATTMLALKNSLKLPTNLWTGSDLCKWEGIGCDGSKRVTRIQIGKLSISGTLPKDLKSLSSLTVLEVMGNNLTGTIPSLAGLKSLATVNFHDNRFTSIETEFFTGLSSLQYVTLDNNPLENWEIPLSLKDATSLVVFSAGNCGLTGKIPDFLGGSTFPSLTTLKLSANALVGELPASFAGSTIQVLLVNGQKSELLNGSISVLQNMTSLTNVSLQGNGFSGTLPDFSGLVSLKSLNLRENKLTGIVPTSLTESKSLSDVALGNNLLQGPTPKFAAAKADMSGLNSFCLASPGPCDSRVNTLLSIAEAFGYPASFAEKWNGNDPCTNGWVGITCSKGEITVINFKNMGLTGTISPWFANFTSLGVIILSQNNLNGIIPSNIATLSSLKTLDVSNNQLCGKVPDFKPSVVVDTNGNPNIGKDCSGSSSSRGNSSGKSGKIVGSVIGVVLVLLLIGFAIFFLVKKKKQQHKMLPQQQHHNSDQEALKITIENLGVSGSESGFSSNDTPLLESANIVFSINILRDATDHFNERNILGRGGFGIVYKGELQDGTKIAVKRMESSVISGKGLDEFKSEIAVLTRVRHKNLVILQGYCVEGNERLLVYQYMPQGTLSRHIFHWQEEGLKPLEWSRRLIIALDVARGVEYLHTLAQQSFIHRDLKPSNILLGDDMHAKVADFGLVRLAPEGTQSIETKIAGTFGYLAPEYAVTGRVTTKVDVYSFGVILMELLTGRKALDDKRSENEVHLATWFRRMFINKESFSHAIDETFKAKEEIQGSINKVAELANHCCAREPQQRPDMSHVVNVLGSLVEQWKPVVEEGSGVSENVYGVYNNNMSLTSSFFELDNTFELGQGR
ncbi:unnamed protein product [Cochlearia groenlandica]